MMVPLCSTPEVILFVRGTRRCPTAVKVSFAVKVRGRYKTGTVALLVDCSQGRCVPILVVRKTAFSVRHDRFIPVRHGKVSRGAG